MPLLHGFTPESNHSYGGGPSQRALANYRANHPSVEARDRCAAMLYFFDGKTLGWVTEEGLSKPYDPEVVLGWVDLWNTGGVEPLIAGL
jgi:hypothetical protein